MQAVVGVGGLVVGGGVEMIDMWNCMVLALLCGMSWRGS